MSIGLCDSNGPLKVVSSEGIVIYLQMEILFQDNFRSIF